MRDKTKEIIDRVVAILESERPRGPNTLTGFAIDAAIRKIRAIMIDMET